MHPMLYEIPEGLPDPNTPGIPNELRTLQMLPQKIGPASPDALIPHGLLIERIYIRRQHADGSFEWEPKPNKYLEEYLKEEYGSDVDEP